jgi:hypothetical protein
MVSHAGTCTEAQYLESHFRNASGVFPDPKAVLSGWNFKAGGITAASFAIGGITSMVSCYLCMMVRFTRAGEEKRGGEAANARLEHEDNSQQDGGAEAGQRRGRGGAR